MEKLAIFDVDFTLTRKETLIQFYSFMVKKNPGLIKHLPKNVFSGLSYLTKRLTAHQSKEKFLGFINNIHEDDMKEIVKEFYEKRLSKILYKDAIDMIKELKKQGFLIYLISASPEFYLNELYNIKEVDMIIGTKMKRGENGLKYCNIIDGFNCKGEEKVKRLNEVLKAEGKEIDFENSYMFSDSLSDLPLMNLVGNPRLINFKKGHKSIEILRWR
ncbi:HAD-IB family hydrolase [Oceanirhabdus sp. W0125-5]|uniref:HAD-IB family hydrolase n=1 Tax=Oceanirhabdus sp. W0125-5 TaxID=2999116 RepID=UPI0022F31A78|nr:HAD-IB family hydrolase [Oceanirhabdus sp. W0125-5]WBW95487.1 HAD-IB family hydrolase [Oceanirhabdus sp. W0125-5]